MDTYIFVKLSFGRGGGGGEGVRYNKNECIISCNARCVMKNVQIQLFFFARPRFTFICHMIILHLIILFRPLGRTVALAQPGNHIHPYHMIQFLFHISLKTHQKIYKQIVINSNNINI